MDIPNLLTGVLGGIIGGACAVAAVIVQDWLNRRGQRENEDRFVKGYLLAIRTEAEALWNRWNTTVGNMVAGLPPGQPLLAFYPVYQEYFNVYVGNAFMLGRVKDPELRSLIVKTYTLARGIIDSMRMNNEMNQKFENAMILFQQTQLAVHQQQANAFHVSLVNYATALKGRHAELHDHIDRLLRLIDGAA